MRNRFALQCGSSSRASTTTPGNDRHELEVVRERVTELLAGLRLRLHPGKTAITPTHAGLTFVGYRTWPRRREVRGSNVRAFRTRLKQMRANVAAGWLSEDELRRRLAGWLGHAAQADDLTLFARVATWLKDEQSSE